MQTQPFVDEQARFEGYEELEEGDIDIGAFDASGGLARMGHESLRDRLGTGMPSKPLLGFLPIARIIPQDVHSVADYANGLTVGSGALFSDDPRAQVASAVLAASDIVVSLCTDYRLSAVKLIPIEAHEAIDHLWGMSAIAAPFVLGYWKTSPKVALAHVLTGVSTILASLLTDYRAVRGVGR